MPDIPAGLGFVGSCEEGRFFGETALVTGRPRNATATTRGPAVLLKVTYSDFKRYLQDAPETLQTIRTVIRGHYMNQLRVIFNKAGCTTLHLSNGQSVYQRGDPLESLYLATAGTITQEINGTIVREIHEGDMFGYYDVLNGYNRRKKNAHCRSERCVCSVMDVEELKQLLKSRPGIAQAMREEASERVKK